MDRIKEIVEEARERMVKMADIQKMSDENIGDWIDEKCPKCGSQLLGNKAGGSWCSLVGCDYKDSHEIT